MEGAALGSSGEEGSGQRGQHVGMSLVTLRAGREATGAEVG